MQVHIINLLKCRVENTLAFVNMMILGHHIDLINRPLFWMKNPIVGVVGGAVKWMTEKPYISHNPEDNRLIKLRLMSNWPFFFHPCSMMRKSVLIKNNVRYEEHIPITSYVVSRLMEFTQFYSLPDVMINYRVHDTRTSVLQAKRMEDAADEIRFLFVISIQCFIKSIWMD